MKKFGFTLMEVIVALGIIGVVAAVTAPVLENLIPDKDKIAVLKTYKIITDINNEILETTSWLTNSPVDCTGLGCLAPPQRIDGREPTANERAFPYEELFAQNLDLKEAIQHRGDVGTVFMTTDGIRWFINGSGNALNKQYIVTIDLMDDKKPHRIYSNSTTKPGQFSFSVNSIGVVSANDPLTAAFLENANKLNDKKNDRKAAKNNNKTFVTPKTWNHK